MSLQTTLLDNNHSILTPLQQLSPLNSSATLPSSNSLVLVSSRPSDDSHARPVIPSFHSLLESLRGELETHRSIMEIHRDSLRAAERTISSLREQIVLHNERVQVSISSFVSSPAPVRRIPTERSALTRSLSSRIARLQDEQRRQELIQQLRAASLRLMPRLEMDESHQGDHLLTLSSRDSSLRPSDQQELISNGCPILTYSIVTSTHISYLVRESADQRINTRERQNVLSSSSIFPSRFFNQDVNYKGHSSGSDSNQESLEREWERQLTDGEVDSNGVPILKFHQPIHSFIPFQRIRTTSSSSRFTSTHLGTRKVEGLGLQLATARSNPQSSNSLSASADHSFHPLCLR